MSRPAPGPWTTKIQGEPNQYFTMRGDGRWLAAIQFNGEMTVAEQDATARLIDAAPDLLAALQNFSAYVHAEQSSTDGAVTYSTTTINHFAFMARAAIAKATGEQNGN